MERERVPSTVVNRSRLAESMSQVVREHGIAAAMAHLIRIMRVMEHHLGDAALPSPPLPDEPSAKARQDARELLQEGQKAVSNWCNEHVPQEAYPVTNSR